MSEKYCGYANYATWKANLEIISDYANSLIETGEPFKDLKSMADDFKENAEQVLTQYDTLEGITVDWAMSLLSQVDWMELARNHSEDLLVSGESTLD